MPRRPRRDGARVAREDRVVARRTVDDPHEVLRLDGMAIRALQRRHLLVPPPLSLLRLLEESTVLLPAKERGELSERLGRVTDERHVDRHPVADPRAIELA